MEEKSIEDDEESVKFNVFVYNVQLGVDIDYSTGKNKTNGKDSTILKQLKNHKNYKLYHYNNELKNTSNLKNKTIEIHDNIKSKIYHKPDGQFYNKISSKNLIIFKEDEAIKAGFRCSKR